MDKLKRGDKIYLNKDKTEESMVNQFLSCRDGIVEVYEYKDEFGYGSATRLFLCEDAKHEDVAIIRQTYCTITGKWIEDALYFDSDSFRFLEALIRRDNYCNEQYTLVRDYREQL